MKIIVTILFIFGVLLRCYAADDYEQCVANLRIGTADAEIKASLATLYNAGVSAFPTLLAHIRDRRPADPSFQRQESNGPTVGGVCFDLFQNRIEGNWPKGYRQYYVLTPANAKQWLQAHRELSLPRLRRVALQESLRRAEADLAAHPTYTFFQDSVAFLRKELGRAEQ